MKKHVNKRSESEAKSGRLSLNSMLKASLYEFVVSEGLKALYESLESERTEICGPKYEHQRERNAHRAGKTKGELVMGGRRVQVSRPRVRSLKGHEIELPTWVAFRDEDPLTERAVEQMLVGVSTRKYARSLEHTEAVTRGTSRSAVSRRFVAKTQAQCEEWLSRNLSELEIRVLMLDGVHFAKHTLIVAMGIDDKGEKHVLGIRDGATENSAVTTELLTDLRSRGLCTTRPMLFVLDGSKALSKAVQDVFGSHALVQRCQVHKASQRAGASPSKPTFFGETHDEPGLSCRPSGNGQEATQCLGQPSESGLSVGGELAAGRPGRDSDCDVV